ncbi:MAG: 4Fe-4S binding protein [Eubacteriales bacterium]
MSKKDKCIVEGYTSWQKTTPGGIVTSTGNAKYYLTGSWRANKPIWDEEKCKHCMLCFPVCPDSSIETKDKKMTGIDYDHCKGCGVCAAVCKFGAIKMVPEGQE